MFELYKKKRTLRKANLEYQNSIVNAALRTLQGATTSDVVQPEKDEAQWLAMDADDSGRLDETEYGTMWERAYKLWDTNLHARAIIRTMVKFVIGKGAIIKFKDDNEKVKKIWDNFKRENSETMTARKRWKRNKWNRKEKEIFTRLFRDGEVIIRLFMGGGETNGLVKMRFIRPSKVKTPNDKGKHRDGEIVTYGIGHDPNDIENYLTYYICDTEGNFQQAIPAEEILHYKLFADSDVKRGISILKVCAPMLTKYEGWLDDRIVLNKIRTAIALIRKVEGTTPVVQKVRDALESETQSTERKKMKMFDKGTILTASGGIDYQMLSPNINAQDVAEDGRNMLLSIAAGAGFPEMILTADYSNANYSSSLVAQNPFVREIEDWQDTALTIYEDITGIVIQNAIDYGPLPDSTSLEAEIGFAPMVHSDMKEEDESYEIQHRNKVLSRKTWQLKRGLDPEIEKANMEDEEGDEVYPPAFQPPGGGGIPSGSEEEEEGFFEESIENEHESADSGRG